MHFGGAQVKNLLLITMLLGVGYNQQGITKSTDDVFRGREDCEDGYVEDCSGDGDCCPESWIGDGMCDSPDQPNGCSLACYSCDGSDCIDECGVCGGEGIPDGDCDCGGNANDECGVCGGDNSSCLDECGVPNGDGSSCSCGGGYVEDCSGDGDCCPGSWIGDGFADCEDQAWGCDLTCFSNDGGDCDEAGGCSTGEFDCGDGSCIYGAWECDGWVDCEDGSDEANCEECGAQTGDTNGDGLWNVIDVVTIANCILQGTCDSLAYACASDVNGNGDITVIDVVLIVNCILQGDCNQLPD